MSTAALTVSALVVSRTATSEPFTASQALLVYLDALAALPPSKTEMHDCTNEQLGAVSSWVDANSDRFYLLSSDASVEVVRRSDSSLLLRWWRK